MALLVSQISLINDLVTATTITATQGLDLLSSPNGFSSTQIAFIQGLSLSASNEALLLEGTNITQNQLEEELSSAKEYVRNGNYLEARRQILLAEMTLAGLSNYELGNRRIEYREGISRIKNSIEDMETRSSNSNKNKRVLARFVRE